MRLLITTQLYENYGSHDWNGDGECPQHWKAKGGNEYVLNLTVGQFAVLGGAGLSNLVEYLSGSIECSNDNYREEIIDWKILRNGELTFDEQSYSDAQYLFDHLCYIPTILPVCPLLDGKRI